MPDPRLEIFSFGYEGWGNATPELVRSVDAVEAARGFDPPVFVDVRIRRGGRAVGFREKTFEQFLGETRYRWMKELGNDSVVTGEDEIRIHDPSAAPELIRVAREVGAERRRILYYCHCLVPGSCHRAVVAGLLVSAAAKSRAALKVEEWPGGEASRATLPVDGTLLQQVRKGRRSVQLGSELPPVALLGLPWGSVVELGSGDESAWVVSGPARFSSGQWYLPVMAGDAFGSEAEASAAGRTFRADNGYEPQFA